MKEYLKIIDEIIALVGLHLIPKFVNLYQGQVDIRCEENDTGVLIAEFNLQMQQNSD